MYQGIARATIKTPKIGPTLPKPLRPAPRFVGTKYLKIMGGYFTPRTDHDLDHIDHVYRSCTYRRDILCRICEIQIQTREKISTMQIIRLSPSSMIYRPCRSYRSGICLRPDTQIMDKDLFCQTSGILIRSDIRVKEARGIHTQPFLWPVSRRT